MADCCLVSSSGAPVIRRASKVVWGAVLLAVLVVPAPAVAQRVVAADPAHGAGRGRRRILIVVTATGVGLLTGFFGVGGGFAVVPALVLALGMAMPTAIGTSLVVIVVNTAVALGSRIAQPVHLDPVSLAVFGGAAVVGSLLGVRAAGRVSPARLSLGFTVLLLVIAVSAWRYPRSNRRGPDGHPQPQPDVDAGRPVAN